MRRRWHTGLGVALLLAAGGLSYPAHAGDFFSNLFGVFGARPPAPPRMILPFGEELSLLQ